jgi:formate/nitrite transporter FocA (FNT family)
LIKNLVPVTLGNIIGGGGLGALMWYCHRPKKDR